MVVCPSVGWGLPAICESLRSPCDQASLSQVDPCETNTMCCLARWCATRASCSGFITCKILQVAESGAHVIATARSLQRAPGLQSLLQTHGALLTVVTLDVTAAASVKVHDAYACASHLPNLAGGRCLSVVLAVGSRLGKCR